VLGAIAAVFVPAGGAFPAEPVAGVSVGGVAIWPVVGVDAGVALDALPPAAAAVGVVGAVEPIGAVGPREFPPGGSRSGPTQLARNTAAAVSVRRRTEHIHRPGSLRSGALLG
jgi:hypothetical protein